MRTCTCCVFTGAIVVVGVRVVVAGCRVGATKGQTAQEVTGAIVDDRFRIVVARKGVGAARYVARDEITGSVVVRGLGVVVASVGCSTSRHFKRIANPVSVVVGNARPVAVVGVFREFTLRRINGCGVVVACTFVQTAGTRGEFA